LALLETTFLTLTLRPWASNLGTRLVKAPKSHLGDTGLLSSLLCLLADFAHLRLSAAVIRDRIAYRKAARDGLSVEELKPTDPKAGEEMQALFREVFHDE
jgi:chromosome partitioning protein